MTSIKPGSWVIHYTLGVGRVFFEIEPGWLLVQSPNGIRWSAEPAYLTVISEADARAAWQAHLDYVAALGNQPLPDRFDALAAGDYRR